MAKAKWDEDGKRLYETGVDQVMLYKKSGSSYPLGVPWSGVTGITEKPAGGDSNKLYADNIEYLNLLSKETFGATLKAYQCPEEFDECDGTAEVATGVNVGMQTRAMFGLSYVTKIGNDTNGEDYGYKLHLIWGGKAAPSERDHATINESPNAEEMSWEISTTPAKIEEHTKTGGVAYNPVSHMVIDSTKANAAKLTALLAILHGTDADPEDPQSVGTDPRLPLPDEVIDLMTVSGGQG